jgi:hypothetical protein
MRDKKDPCPRCGSEKTEDGENKVVKNITHMMYGMKVENKCLDCSWEWTLSVAEEPDSPRG